MSRAFCVTMPIDDMIVACARNQATISTVEPLASGGTRMRLEASNRETRP